VTDNGSSQGSIRPGDGLKIVDALARELNGEIFHRFGADGALSVLIFPVSGETPQTKTDSLINDDPVCRRRAICSPETATRYLSNHES
jgi:hypothetical protein